MGKFVLGTTGTGFRFHLHAANGQVVATSESYHTLAACHKGVESVRTCAATANFVDLTEEEKLPANPRFELYRDKAGRFRFRLRARNGKIIAVSEGYVSHSACEDGIDSVRKNAPDATVE